MQFYKNFAWMDNNNDVVIFQPDRDPKGFSYNANTTDLVEQEQPQPMVKMAHANALWGSLAYQNSFYKPLPEK